MLAAWADSTVSIHFWTSVSVTASGVRDRRSVYLEEKLSIEQIRVDPEPQGHFLSVWASRLGFALLDLLQVSTPSEIETSNRFDALIL
jgi:hypothetical protein